MEYMGPVESNWPVTDQHLDTLRVVIVHNAEPGDWLCPEWMATCGVWKPADIPASPWQSVNDQLLYGVQWLDCDSWESTRVHHPDGAWISLQSQQVPWKCTDGSMVARTVQRSEGTDWQLKSMQQNTDLHRSMSHSIHDSAGKTMAEAGNRPLHLERQRLFGCCCLLFTLAGSHPTSFDRHSPHMGSQTSLSQTMGHSSSTEKWRTLPGTWEYNFQYQTSSPGFRWWTITRHMGLCLCHSSSQGTLCSSRLIQNEHGTTVQSLQPVLKIPHTLSPHLHQNPKHLQQLPMPCLVSLVMPRSSFQNIPQDHVIQQTLKIWMTANI